MKIFISLLLVLSVVCFASTAYVYYKAESLKQQISALEVEKNKIAEQLKGKEAALVSAVSEKDRLEEEKGSLQAEYDRLSQEARTLTEQVSKEVALRQDIEKKLNESAFKFKIEGLEKQLDESKEKNDELAGTLDKVTLEKDAIAQEKDALSDDLAKVKADIERLLENKQGVELKKIVVKRPQARGKGKKPSEGEAERLVRHRTSDTFEEKERFFFGKILVYNSEYDFVIIDVGARDGIEKGKTFRVTDNGKPIGRIRVEKVYERLSAAVIVERESKAMFQKDNSIISL